MEESLEEAAEKYDSKTPFPNDKNAFIKGAKWQQEQDKLKIDNIRSDEAFKFELKSIDKFSNGYDAGYEEAEKRSYSEEEVLKLLNKSCNYIYDSSKIGTDKKLMPNLLIGWFEQFKKK